MNNVAITHLLVPIDFGPCSDAALGMAVSLARTLGARLTLVHVVEHEIVAYPGVPFAPTIDLTAERTMQAKTELEALRDKLPAEVRGEALLRHGSPVDELLATASELRANLIVMGTHGRRGLARAIVGSTTESVVRRADVPVLTVHAGTQ